MYHTIFPFSSRHKRPLPRKNFRAKKRSFAIFRTIPTSEYSLRKGLLQHTAKFSPTSCSLSKNMKHCFFRTLFYGLFSTHMLCMNIYTVFSILFQLLKSSIITPFWKPVIISRRPLSVFFKKSCGSQNCSCGIPLRIKLPLRSTFFLLRRGSASHLSGDMLTAYSRNMLQS